MLEKIKGFFKRNLRKVSTAMIGAVATSMLAVSAFAADETATQSGGNMAGVINSAGTSLEAEFVTMVNSLVPIVISIAMVGLGFYAIIYLFKTAKKLFAQAAE